MAAHYVQPTNWMHNLSLALMYECVFHAKQMVTWLCVYTKYTNQKRKIHNFLISAVIATQSSK